MTEILQTNIFFLITSVAVVAVTILVAVALFYLVSILRDVKDISGRIKRGSEIVGKDLSALRMVFKREGGKTQTIFTTFLDRFQPKKKKGVKKKKTNV